MNFFPEISFEFKNGILPFSIYLIIFIVTIFCFSKEKRTRLCSKKQTIYMSISKIFTLLNIILITFSKITNETYLIVAGIVLFIIGSSIMVLSIINFCSTPINKVVTKGLYKYSRNPQMIGIWIIFLGIGILINSILSILFLSFNIIFAHQYIKAEEKFCVSNYKDEYKKYFKSVPRYF